MRLYWSDDRKVISKLSCTHPFIPALVVQYLTEIEVCMSTEILLPPNLGNLPCRRHISMFLGISLTTFNHVWNFQSYCLAHSCLHACINFSLPRTGLKVVKIYQIELFYAGHQIDTFLDVIVPNKNLNN